jgi:hypothetical protein
MGRIERAFNHFNGLDAAKDVKMNSSSLPAQQSYVPTENRNVKKVPFVELVDNRLQGVVSSGSDIERVYIAYFEAGSLDHSCTTNNNRPCGGGGVCSHLKELMEEAVIQYGLERVGKFLRMPGDMWLIRNAQDILWQQRGHNTHSASSDIFSRFLAHLQLLELQSYGGPMPTMTWFVG